MACGEVGSVRFVAAAAPTGPEITPTENKTVTTETGN